MLVVIAVLLAVIGLLLMVRRRPKLVESPAPPVSSAVVPSDAGEVDLSEIMQAVGALEATGPQPLVIPQEADGTALVVAERSVAESWGTIVAQAGPRIEATARRASNATQAGITAAERAGYLVKLHPDSVKALKELKPDAVKGAAGYIQATLRDSHGHYAHVIKIKQVANLQTLSSGAAVLSALAMQAQLDRIEHSLASLQASVESLADEQHDLQDAKRDALEASFGETYRIAHQVGQLTRVQWDALPKPAEAYELRASTVRAVKREQDKLRSLPGGAKDRAAKLEASAERLERLLVNMDRDDRLVGQAQVLLLWRMTSTKDPALGAALQELRTQAAERLRERDDLLSGVEAVLVDPDVRSTLQKVRWRRRRQIRRSGHELSWEVRQHRQAVAEATPSQLMIGPGPDHAVSETYTLTQDEAVILAIAQMWMMRSDAEFANSSRKHADFAAFRDAVDDGTVGISDPDLIASLGDFPRTPSDDLVPRLCSRSQNRVRSLLLLIELVAFHPWSPSDPERPLKTATTWDEDSREHSLRRLATWLTGTTEADADYIEDTYRDVMANAGRGSRNWWVVGGLAAAGVGLGALTGGLAAPAIGAFIGSTVFGLSGAAATSAGLAALGGGSLAAGGFGMAGGTALIAGVGGVAAGSLVGGASTAVQTIGADERRAVVAKMAIDLVKLQVLTRIVLIEELHDYGQVTVVVQELGERQAQVEKRLRDLGEASADEDVDPDAVAVDEESQLKLLAKALDRAADDLLRRRGEDARSRR